MGRGQYGRGMGLEVKAMGPGWEGRPFVYKEREEGILKGEGCVCNGKRTGKEGEGREGQDRKA